MNCDPFKQVDGKQTGVWDSCDSMLGGIKGVPVNLDFISVPKIHDEPQGNIKKPVVQKSGKVVKTVNLNKQMGNLSIKDKMKK